MELTAAEIRKRRKIELKKNVRFKIKKTLWKTFRILKTFRLKQKARKKDL